MTFYQKAKAENALSNLACLHFIGVIIMPCVRKLGNGLSVNGV